MSLRKSSVKKIGSKKAGGRKKEHLRNTKLGRTVLVKRLSGAGVYGQGREQD